jgi:hypothetical protein
MIRQILLASLIVYGSLGIFLYTTTLGAKAQPAPVVTPEAPIIVEEPGRVRGFLEMLKTNEGRAVLLVKLAELREATLLMAPSPPAPPGEVDKRQEMLREVDELENLLQQYHQVAPESKKGG